MLSDLMSRRCSTPAWKVGLCSIFLATCSGADKHTSKTHDEQSIDGVTTVAPRGVVLPQSNDLQLASSLVVKGVVRSGEPFEITFTGRLVSSRGGYFWVQRSGVRIALLRSDGNDEIPMGYETNQEDWVTVDDAVSGEKSNLILPDLAGGDYELCTANSVVSACTPISVVNG